MSLTHALDPTIAGATRVFRAPCGKSGLLAAAVVAFASQAAAQLVPDWTVRMSVGSALTAGLTGVVTNDAGTTAVCGINGPSSNTDAVTAVWDRDGNLLWSDSFNGPQDWHDQARAIAFGPGGVVWTVGNTPGPGFFSNILLIQYDLATGARLNTTIFSSSPGIAEFAGAVATDPNGNVYIGGGTVGDGPDVLVARFDPTGSVVWTRTWDGPAASPFSQDHVRQVKIAPDGNVLVLISGVMTSLHPDYVLIKYDAASGQTVWETRWGVAGDDTPLEMVIDPAGDIYVTGTGLDFTNKIATIKVRGSDGALLWQAYDWAGLRDSGRGIALDGAGGVYITGSVDPDGDQSNFNDNFYTVKRNAATGALIWTHSFGANCVGCFDVPADVSVDAAGNVLVGGQSSSPPYSADAILFALDAGTGTEINRGVVTAGVNEGVGFGIQQFDATWNLYVGGEGHNFNTGATDITLTRFPSLVGGTPGDIDGDGDVDLTDLSLLLDAFGTCDGDAGFDPAADFDGSGCVDLVDLSTLLSAFGT